MKSFIKNVLLLFVLILLIYVYFKEYRPKVERYDKLKIEEQEIIKELNTLKVKVDSLTNLKSDNMAKYTYETMQKELKTDSIRVWKTDEGVKLEVNEKKIFESKKSKPTKEGERLLNKLLSSVVSTKKSIKIEVLINTINDAGTLRIKRGEYIMKQLIEKYNVAKNDIQINVLLVKKGLSGINIEIQ